ncbi:MAG: aminotransferase class V-fold PLP-dependent enzyme [Byssovorax sp.]
MTLDRRALRRHWTLDPEITFLNHGSFGACPVPVLEAQSELRARMEREPVRFFIRELPGLAEAAAAEVGAFLGADAADLAFVSNATMGVNTVLRSLDLAPGDELLTHDHAYNACKNALDFVAEKAGAKVVVAKVPFPVASPDTVVDSVLACVTSRTRLAMIDQITSPTALVFPVDRLVSALAERGVDTLVDAAHAPGMVPLHLDRTGAAYTTGNFHKWTCAPKGAAFLHVRRDRQAQIRPLSISHGANAPRTERSRFRVEADWTGTMDPTPALCLPAALRFLGSLLPGGMSALMEANRAEALRAQTTIAGALGVAPPCPPEMVGSMASFPVSADGPPTPPLGIDVLQDTLYQRFKIEIPVFPWPPLGKKIIRFSTPIYIGAEEIARLASALGELDLAGRSRREGHRS